MLIHYLSLTFLYYSSTQLHFLFLLYCIGNFEPSQIFRKYYADICEAIEVNPLPIINRLYSAFFISYKFKLDVENMSNDYNKADKVVDELEQQVIDKGIESLKSICDFFLKQNQLKDIGMEMKHQLESKRF